MSSMIGLITKTDIHVKTSLVDDGSWRILRMEFLLYAEGTKGTPFNASQRRPHPVQ